MKTPRSDLSLFRVRKKWFVAIMSRVRVPLRVLIHEVVSCALIQVWSILLGNRAMIVLPIAQRRATSIFVVAVVRVVAILMEVFVPAKRVVLKIPVSCK